MALKKAKFLLDENLDVKLVKVLTSLGLTCSTLKSKGWIGIKNGALSQRVKENNFVLITADKDFIFLWDKYKIQVIYVSIHPRVLSFIEPKLVSLFKSWNYNLSKPFLLILQQDSIRLRQ